MNPDQTVTLGSILFEIKTMKVDKRMTIVMNGWKIKIKLKFPNISLTWIFFSFSRLFLTMATLNIHWQIQMGFREFARNPHYFIFMENFQKNQRKVTLKAPITTSRLFCHLLKSFISLLIKHCGPRSDCSYWSRLIWVHTVFFYT